MKKILFALMLSLFPFSTKAQVVYYPSTVYIEPAPVIIQQPTVIYNNPTYVIRQPTTTCAWYVDPYDLFGQLFGDPDLVQSCITTP